VSASVHPIALIGPASWIDKWLYIRQISSANGRSSPGSTGTPGTDKKCTRHGVSLHAIEALFQRPIAMFRDRDHSRVEERFKAIGKTDTGRRVLIVFALRERIGGTFIRPISARYMHAKEVAHYEEEAAKIAQR
jgi:hypothetical protein